MRANKKNSFRFQNETKGQSDACKLPLILEKGTNIRKCQGERQREFLKPILIIEFCFTIL